MSYHTFIAADEATRCRNLELATLKIQKELSKYEQTSESVRDPRLDMVDQSAPRGFPHVHEYLVCVPSFLYAHPFVPHSPRSTPCEFDCCQREVYGGENVPMLFSFFRRWVGIFLS